MLIKKRIAICGIHVAKSLKESLSIFYETATVVNVRFIQHNILGLFQLNSKPYKISQSIQL